MKKSVSFTILAIVLIVTGLILGGAGFMMRPETDKSATSEKAYKQYTYTTQAAVDVLDFSVVSDNCIYTPTDDSFITISYMDDAEDPLYIISERDGKLSMHYKSHSSKSWFSLMDFTKEDLFEVFDDAKHTITVSVPRDLVCDYNHSSVSGDITFENLNAVNLDFDTVSGDCSVQNVTVNAGLDFSTVSGSCTLKQLSCGDKCDIDTTSGSLTVENVTAKVLDFDTVSGSVRGDLNVSDSVSASTTSGSVHLALSGSPDQYRIESGTVSGRNNLPEKSGSSNSKSLSVNTVSGDIDVTFGE